jgi:hypothetical protein
MTLSNRYQKFGMTDLSSIGGILFDLDGVLYWRYGFVSGQGIFLGRCSCIRADCDKP